MKRYHLMGTCHVDVAWHGDEEQYANYLEQFTVILLDMLDQYPDMTYMIEQAYHYRKLKERRPDLIERLKKLIAEGRVEVVGGMISTADSNMPCSESIVRNQLLGLRWFEQEIGAKVETAWLVDAFGSHAQIPQVFESFKMKQMMSTRFGGDKHHDYFIAEGLDGTKLLVAGRDAFSLNLPTPERSRIFLDFVIDGTMIDALFDRIRRTRLDGPIMVDVYVEDETYPNRRMMTQMYNLKKFAEDNGDEAVFSLPRDFFNELRELNEELPVEFADLNPEFTGTYAQRVEIRLHNRRAETALLDAEKWLALLGKPYGTKFDDAWWDMGFVHFHDVFTGSHPESVFLNVLDRLDNAKALADESLSEIFGSEEITPAIRTLCVTNSLPYSRKEWISIPCQTPISVRDSLRSVPSYLSGGRLWFIAEVDACASAIYTLEPCEEGCIADSKQDTVLENEFVVLTLDSKNGVTLLEKKTGRTLLNCAKDLLVLQGDTGNFQIEQVETTEQHAWASPVWVEREDAYSAVASGTFENKKGEIEATWKIIFTVRPGDPMIGFHVHADWKAVGQRLRVKLNTTLTRACEGIYEVPFGVVHRRPYTPGFCRKGEWPAQRFVAIEDGEAGIALINDGVPGVETLGGSMYSTILRAPVQVYSGMIPDHSSQQHGEHDFSFAIVAYAGEWSQNDLLRMGQRWNTPLRVYAACQNAEEIASLLAIDNPTIMLSAVKEAIADENAMLLRLTESTGIAQNCIVKSPGAAHAYAANMLEEKLEELTVENGIIELTFKPWEIRTVYIERE